MRYIDLHTHTYFRSTDDLQLMAVAGVEAVNICAFFPIEPTYGETLIDFFDWLIEEEASRVESCGLIPYVSAGIHPRSIPKNNFDDAANYLLALIDHGKISAVAEVGMDSGSQKEEEALRIQLRFAVEYDMPILIHTPRVNKPQILNKLLAILEDERVDSPRVLIDHVTPDLVKKVLDFGAFCGLTVQPGKLTPTDVAAVLREHGSKQLVVNSDLGMSPSDPLALPKTAKHLDREGFSAADIERILYHNPKLLLR